MLSPIINKIQTHQDINNTIQFWRINLPSPDYAYDCGNNYENNLKCKKKKFCTAK